MNAGRFALSAVAAASLYVASTGAWALGLGRLSVQSALGETLKAEIDVTSLTPEEASTLRVRIAPPESYRAAGVDFNPVLMGTNAVVQRRPDGRTVLRLNSDRAVQEPFVDVILEVTSSSGRLVREYTLLFDPPTGRPTPAAPPVVGPSLSSAPAATPAAQAPAAAPAPAPMEAPATRAPRAAAPSATPAPAPLPRPVPPMATTPAPAGQQADQYAVRPGDTLSRIAGKTLRPGVSLDQMLVSLYRGNPDAFINNNMNRLKAGVVLSVPSADSVKAVTPADARQVIQAQSADFGAYRQRLAGAAPQAKTETPTRQAAGQVQASVDDRKQAAQTPDKLTLTQGAARASAPEARLSKEAERKDTSTRVAELSRNVEDLKRLSAASAAKPATTPAAPAPAPVVAAAPKLPVTTPAAVTPPAPVPAPAPAPVVAAPPAPVVASAPAAAPAAEPAPVVASAPAAAPPAPVVASAPRPAASRPKAVPGPVAEEPGLFDNPLVLPAAGVLLAGLAGLAFYRFRSRAKRDSGETSFLESKLQPDSFFGASGGQRIDTRDASGVSSSMSYSLSQLDAIGDVDPVAEADVYLAYGRDLQAEEILKEAMRGNPDRLAIRTKLLEVYAKRRDTKGFELLATQLFALTQGQGEDWQKAQELGRGIDPENPLYQPGGQPSGGREQTLSREPMGASTMPHSVMPTASAFAASMPPAAAQPEAPAAPAPRAPEPAGDLDLNLDVPSTDAPPAPATYETTAASGSNAGLDLDFPLGEVPAPAGPVPSANAPLEFDLGSLSLDLDTPAKPASAGSSGSSDATLGGLDLPAVEGAGDATDPLVRKLELAEEFRQIGDTEGARDLLEEVVAKADGSLKAKAQGMLETLA